jgi:PAS domain S-box-containing protein
MVEDKGEGKPPSLRERAEKLLSIGSASLEGLSPHELASLFHELQVHQIELKMQNEELRSAQQELERSRKKYFELYDLAPVGYLTLDRTGLILEANLKAGDLLGQPRSYLLRQNFRDFVVASYWIVLAEHLRAVGEEGEWQTCELELLKRDRSRLTAHLETIRVDKGEKEEEDDFEFRCAFIDISERKVAEETLYENQARLETVFAAIPYAIVEYDANLKPVRANEIAMKAAGVSSLNFTRDQVAAKLKFKRLDGSAVRTEDLPTSRALRGDTVVEDEYVITDAEGVERVISAYAVPLYQNGKVKGVIAVWDDITKRKRAEEALRQSEEDFRALAEALPQIVWTADAEGSIEWFNQRWYDYTGEPEGAGEGWSWDKAAHPDDMAHALKSWQEARQRGALFQNEIRVRRYDGRYRWFLVRAWPLRGAEGKVCRWFGTNTDVHDMKETETALHQSREDLDRAQEVGQIGWWRLDTRQDELTWSDETHRIFGVPRGTPLTYETYLGFVHPDDREYVDTRWKAALRGEPYDIEHRILVAGQIKWVRGKAYLEFDKEGVLVGAFGIAQNITDRKRLELMLQRNLKEHQVILDSVPAMVFYKDKENRFLRTNKAFETAMKLPKEDLEGKSMFQLYPKEQAEAYWRDDQEVMTSGRAKRGIVEFMQTPVGTRLIQTDKIPYLDELGNVIGVVGFAVDITEQRQAEKALRESEERFRMIASSTPDHLLIQDRELRYSLVVNPQLGLTEADMIGKTDYDILGKEDADRITVIKRRVLDSGEPVRLEAPLTDSAGALQYFEGSYVPTFDEKEQVTGLIGYFRNVTDRRRAEEALRASEEALRQTNEQLEEKVRERTAELTTLTENLLESRDQLRSLATELAVTEARERRALASELHDTVAQMLALAQMTLKSAGARVEGKPAEEVERAIQLLEEGIHQTRTLMGSLSPSLLYEAGLGPALRALAQKMGELHSVAIEVVDDGSPKPFGEDTRIVLFRAVQELLTNAVKHAKANRVQVSLSREDRTVRIEVKDDGVGFLPSEVRSGSAKGERYGLLSIRERMQHLGGRFEVVSRPGEGVRAVLVMPLRLKEDEKAAPSRVRIVIADDHKLMRDGLRGFLEKEPGFEIVGEAANGLEAVHLTSEMKPDVVIMDINMPVMDGIEATRQTKQALPEVKVIGLTAYAQNSVYSQALSAGASSFVLKSASAEELTKAIWSAVRSGKGDLKGKLPVRQ